MTRDDIVRMAQEAAIMPPGWGATENQWRALHAFADFVAAAENEACAKVCEDIEAVLEEFGALNRAAVAIRARGQA